jgi:hypothetical protein
MEDRAALTRSVPSVVQAGPKVSAVLGMTDQLGSSLPSRSATRPGVSAGLAAETALIGADGGSPLGDEHWSCSMVTGVKFEIGSFRSTRLSADIVDVDCQLASSRLAKSMLTVRPLRHWELMFRALIAGAPGR